MVVWHGFPEPPVGEILCSALITRYGEVSQFLANFRLGYDPLGTPRLDLNKCIPPSSERYDGLF